MRWQGGEKSDNLEDRRGIRPQTAALGGGGLLVVLLIGYLLGIDPQQLNQLIDNAQVGVQGGANGQVEERPLTPEEERSRDFSATILKFTEEVWSDQFRQSGQRYQPPRMVLFSESVQTGCGNAPAAVGPFYCPADRTEIGRASCRERV